MTHLSELEVMEYLDAPGSAGEDASRHIAGCERCRRMVELQRQLHVSAAHIDRGLVSKNFTKRIMRETAAAHTSPRVAWLMENSANLLAMIFVVGIVGFVIFSSASPSPDATESVYGRQLAIVHNIYTSAMQTLEARNQEAMKPVVTETHSMFGTVFFIGLAALLLLGFLDRLPIVSRILKTR